MTTDEILGLLALWILGSLVWRFLFPSEAEQERRKRAREELRAARRRCRTRVEDDDGG